MAFLRPIPEREVRWADPRLRPAWAVLVLAALVVLAFLPKTLITGDEALYAGQARTMLHGRIVPLAGDPVPSGQGQYPPGWPAALMLGALFGFRGMFVVTLAFHLLGGAMLARILVRRGLPAVAIAVYLFHPVFWNLSRTLMSDVPMAAMLVTAVDGWEQRRVGQSAGGIFMMLATRLAASFAVAGLGLAVLPRLKARWRDLSWVAGASALAAVAFALANNAAYGHPFRSPYAAGGAAMFGMGNIRENLPLYLAGILFIPPFPLPLILWRPRACDRWVLAAVPVLLMLLTYSFHDRAGRPLEALIVGQRLVIPAHVALLIGTAGVWAELPVFRSVPLVLAGSAIAAIAQVLMTRHVYSRYEPALAAIERCAPARVAYNWNAAKVALSLDAPEFIDMAAHDPLPADVVVFSERAPTNQGNEMPLDFHAPASLRAEGSKCRKLGEFSVIFQSTKCAAPESAPACDLAAEVP